MAIDVQKLKEDFPILKRKVNGKTLVYLDSAASSEKPMQVIEAVQNCYKNSYANIHRGLHTLSAEATELYETARKKIASFINASPKETVFVRNATEGINLVARSFVSPRLKEGDLIVLTEMEHHSNIIPWQLLSKEKKAKIEYIPFDEEGKLDMKKAEELLAKGPKFFSFIHASNVLGTINPAKELIELAHKNDVPVLVDAAQSVPHMPLDVKELDADFLVFSGHKMCGPSGIGILYGKKELLEGMDPFLGGGDMIKEVSFEGASWNDLPWKFEAGTPNIEGVIGLGAAVEYLENIGMKDIEDHEKDLTQYALERLKDVPDLKIYGPSDASARVGVIAFNLADIHAHDLTTVLDEDGVAVRSGHHCAQPLLDKIGIPASARMSFYLYTTRDDVDQLVSSLKRAREIFRL